MTKIHLHIHTTDAVNEDASVIQNIRAKLTSASSDLESLASRAHSDLVIKAAVKAEGLVDQARRLLFNVQ